MTEQLGGSSEQLAVRNEQLGVRGIAGCFGDGNEQAEEFFAVFHYAFVFIRGKKAGFFEKFQPVFGFGTFFERNLSFDQEFFPADGILRFG
jgi:hypothetical protein